MRIAICGISNLSKIAFVTEFLKTWPMYKKVNGKYKKAVTEQKNITVVDPREALGSQRMQQAILNAIVDETMEYKKDDNVLHDYSILDNLSYTFWLKSHGYGNISEEFINQSQLLARQAIHFYDLILYLPKLDKYDDEQFIIEEDEIFYQEYDNFLRAMHDTYLSGKEWLFEFSSVDGVPAMLEIFGNTAERIQMCKLYLDVDGQPFGKKSSDSLIQLPNLGLGEARDVDNLIKQVQK